MRAACSPTSQFETTASAGPLRRRVRSDRRAPAAPRSGSSRRRRPRTLRCGARPRWHRGTPPCTGAAAGRGCPRRAPRGRARGSTRPRSRRLAQSLARSRSIPRSRRPRSRSGTGSASSTRVPWASSVTASSSAKRIRVQDPSDLDERLPDGRPATAVPGGTTPKRPLLTAGLLRLGVGCADRRASGRCPRLPGRRQVELGEPAGERPRLGARARDVLAVRLGDQVAEQAPARNRGEVARVDSEDRYGRLACKPRGDGTPRPLNRGRDASRGDGLVGQQPDVAGRFDQSSSRVVRLDVDRRMGCRPRVRGRAGRCRSRRRSDPDGRGGSRRRAEARRACRSRSPSGAGARVPSGAAEGRRRAGRCVWRGAAAVDWSPAPER